MKETSSLSVRLKHHDENFFTLDIDESQVRITNGDQSVYLDHIEFQRIVQIVQDYGQFCEEDLNNGY